MNPNPVPAISRAPRTTGAALILTLAILASLPASAADPTSAAQQLERWSAQAGAPGNAGTGSAFFSSRHGGEWSCSSCHGNPPTQPGRHANTGKEIAPLAPAFNPSAFTDAVRADKWFRRNCKDVLARECSAAEKADVLAYLTGLRR